MADDTQELLNERGKIYGTPVVHFSRVAKLWSVIDECNDPRARVALKMACVKMARLIESPAHEDSWRDLAGYAMLGIEVTRE